MNDFYAFKFKHVFILLIHLMEAFIVAPTPVHPLHPSFISYSYHLPDILHSAHTHIKSFTPVFNYPHATTDLFTIYPIGCCCLLAFLLLCSSLSSPSHNITNLPLTSQPPTLLSSPLISSVSPSPPHSYVSLCSCRAVQVHTLADNKSLFGSR